MLEARLLGQFEIRLDGAVVVIPSRPAQSLLAYLLLNPGAQHPREKLAGLLWPDVPEANARRNLRQALWHVRHAIPPHRAYFLVDDLSIAFDARSDYWLDTAVLDGPIPDGASADDLIRVVSLYRGELLPGFYQEWVVAERERLRSVVERKLNTLLNQLTEAQRWVEVLQWGEQWIALSRSPEPAFRALMAAHHGLGDHAGVAATFQRCAHALRGDLGVEPSAQTRELYERLTRDGQASAGQPPQPAFTARYRFESEIGRGGMSVVYRAHDTLLDRPVAIKVLVASGLGTEGRARWLREAQAAARLTHPNIVPVYDVGEADLPAHGGKVPCIVMELIEGGSLHTRRPRKAALAETVAIARQLCAALEKAHRHGIIHRDLKPENVLLAPDGAAKLMDFGLARTPTSRITSEGAIVGTPFYLAPELFLGQASSPQSDLYALGVMLYELTTGRLPFTGDDPLLVISQHLHAPVVPPREVNPEIPPTLDALIVRLLSKSPADRPASAAEVRDALDAWESARPAPRAPLTNLPAQPTPFVGRERELAEIAAHLANPDCRLLTLIGPGGIGKTRLALEAAAARAPSFPDGVGFVPLAPVSAADYLLSTVAEGLKFSFYGGEDPRVQLLNYLSDRRMLLVMDNFEHLLDGAGLLAEILGVAPQVKLLVTSQERLNLHGEWLYEVQGMRVPPSESEDAETYGSIKLFLQSARRVDAGFQLSPQARAAVVRICELVAGMPLGIELAAAWVRALSCAEIAGEIERNLSFLRTTMRDVPERHRSVQAVFDHAWGRLAGDERDVFRKLSVFWGGFQREAAEQVAGATLPLLSALVDKSLLRRSASGRYEMHELLRKYAQKKLKETGEAEAVWARHRDYFLRLAEEAEPGLRRADQLEWLARLETEHDNFRAAMKWSLKSGALEAGLRIAGDLARFWYLRGYWDEGREWLNELLQQSVNLASAASSPEAAECAKQARVKALYGAAWLANEGEAEAPLYAEALALSREVGDKWGMAFSLRGLGARAVNYGEYAPAAEHLDESRKLFQELGDAWGAALVLFNQGWPAHDRGDYEEARGNWEESAKLFRGTGDRWGLAVALGSLSYLARLESDYARSTKLLEESLALFHELGDKAGIATSLGRLGVIAFRRGDFRQAARLFDESQALQHELGSQWGIVSAFSSRGLVACYQGDFQRATDALNESLEHAQEISDREDYAFLLDHFALVAHYQGDNERAAQLWQESLAFHRQHEYKYGIAFALSGLGLVAHVQGDYAGAREALAESLALYRDLRDKRNTAVALNGLGRVARAEGDLVRALELFKESLALRKEVSDKHGIAEAMEGLAGVYAVQGHGEKAARLLGTAQAIREMIGAPIPPVERAEYEQTLSLARAGLDEAAFTTAWNEGRETTVKKVIAEA